MRRQPFLAGSIAIAAIAFSFPVQEAAAQSQQAPQPVQTRQEGHLPEGMMGGRMMDKGMMSEGYHRGATSGGMMMRMTFSLMDADGDGSISLQEFQAAHERIFKGMDQNKDGRLTMEEMQSFMRGR